MRSVRTVCGPQFNSQLGSSGRGEPQPDQAEPPSQFRRDKRGNKRADVGGEKPRLVLKVKLPKFSSRTVTEKAPDEDKTPREWVQEPATNKTRTTVSPGGETQCAGTEPDSAGGDVFFFPTRPTCKATKEKVKAKLAVLRTISRMLEENQLIRQRLTTLSQAN